MAHPLITVVTVVLNDSNNIEATINSVLSQDYPHIEYIIIDGGSLDGTLGKINKYKNKIKYLISERDNGLYDAMNKGTCLATGHWIAYLNSGDIFSSDDIIYRIFSENYNLVSSMDVIYSDVIINSKSYKKCRKAKSLNSFWRGLPFSHQSHFIRATIAKAKLFNLEYKVSADYDFLYSVFKTKASFYYFDYPISICDGTKGISKNIGLVLLYKQSLKICITYSTPLQFIFRLFILIPELIYANIRKFYLYFNKVVD